MLLPIVISVDTSISVLEVMLPPVNSPLKVPVAASSLPLKVPVAPFNEPPKVPVFAVKCPFVSK